MSVGGGRSLRRQIEAALSGEADPLGEDGIGRPDRSGEDVGPDSDEFPAADEATPETVRRGKPHPDVFLAAAQRLGVQAEACVVFEDSQHGARAAQSAGMRCIVRPSVPPEHLAGLPCHVVTSWDEVGEQDVFWGT